MYNTYFNYNFQKFRILMNNDIKDSIDFQNYLRKVEEVRTEQVNVDIFFQDLYHRIYILEKAEITMPKEDIKHISYMKDEWIMLQKTASEKRVYLQKAKVIWSHTIQINIELFSNSINTFLKNYLLECSENLKDDLNLGLNFMNVRREFILSFFIIINFILIIMLFNFKIQEYNVKFTEMMHKKDQLVKEEELFNLKLLNTERFDKYYSEFQYMRLVYSLYEKQKSDIEKWSKIQWTEIGIEFVREAFGALMLMFKRLPVLAQKTQPAKYLENYLKELKHSIPILQQLKNDALKLRHWKEMLDIIGK